MPDVWIPTFGPSTGNDCHVRCMPRATDMVSRPAVHDCRKRHPAPHLVQVVYVLNVIDEVFLQDVYLLFLASFDGFVFSPALATVASIAFASALPDSAQVEVQALTGVLEKPEDVRMHSCGVDV